MTNLDRAAAAKRDVLCDFVAAKAARAQLVTIAASNDDLPLSALVSMLERLRIAKRDAVRLIVNIPLNDYLGTPANDSVADELPSAPIVGASWAAASNIDVVSCAQRPVPADVLHDPWENNPSASILYWHWLAREVIQQIKKEPEVTHIGIFDDWTASARGVSYSLGHVTNQEVPRVTLHMGADVPGTSNRRINKAPFRWMLPLK
jgi:hypothetical protein